MANPSGFNRIFTQEVPYGEKQLQGNLERLAPLPGAPTAALNAPKRGQRATQRPQNPQTSPQAGAPQPQQVSQQAMVEEFWRQAAQLPGASPLVQQIANGQA